MKYLTDYTNEPMNKALEKHRAFFGFSTEQINEAIEKNGLKGKRITRITNISGLFCPSETVDEFLKELEGLADKAIAQDIAENGIDNIIRRELANYECWYTGDPYPAIEALDDYGIEEPHIWRIFSEGEPE